MSFCHVPRVLIYCHPVSFHDKDHPHWLKSTIDTIVRRYSGSSDAHYYTLDIQQVDYGAPSFLADGFDDAFLDEEQGRYNFVFLPDCAGPWWTTQNWSEVPENERDPGAVWEKLKLILVKLTKLLRPAGRIVFGKIVHPEVEHLVGLDKDITTETRGSARLYSLQKSFSDVFRLGDRVTIRGLVGEVVGADDTGMRVRIDDVEVTNANIQSLSISRT